MAVLSITRQQLFDVIVFENFKSSVVSDTEKYIDSYYI